MFCWAQAHSSLRTRWRIHTLCGSALRIVRGRHPVSVGSLPCNIGAVRSSAVTRCRGAGVGTNVRFTSPHCNDFDFHSDRSSFLGKKKGGGRLASTRFTTSFRPSSWNSSNRIRITAPPVVRQAKSVRKRDNPSPANETDKIPVRGTTFSMTIAGNLVKLKHRSRFQRTPHNQLFWRQLGRSCPIFTVLPIR